MLTFKMFRTIFIETTIVLALLAGLPAIGQQESEVKGQPKYYPGADLTRKKRPQNSSTPSSNPPADSIPNEMVGGDGSGGDGGTNYGQSAFGNGPGLSGPPPRGMVCVDGCTSEQGKFQTVFGKSGNQNCDKCLAMSPQLREFMDQHFVRCIKEAVGNTDPITDGKIFHAGVIGDARHQTTGSLHNFGLAIDINAIRVNGTVYEYSNKDAKTQGFFTRLRQCWGKAAQSFRNCPLPSTRKDPNPGTIGHEDHRHHNHLHLSMPFCTAQRPAGAFIALWFALLSQTAHAQDWDPPQSKITTKTVRLDSIGTAKVEIEDTQGEPVGADKLLTVDLICKGKKPKRLDSKIESCQFESIKYDSKSKTLTLSYLVSVLEYDGVLYCKKRERKTYKVECP